MTAECPVARVIREIGGSDEDVESVKIGGRDGLEFVIDDTSFYTMTRKLELARLKMRPYSDAMFDRYFGHMHNKTYGEALIVLMPRIRAKKYLTVQFAQMVDVVDKLEAAILERIRTSGSLNLSLPTMLLDGFIGDAIEFHPVAAEIGVNALVSYFNKLNVAAITNTTTTEIEKLETFNRPFDETKKIGSTVSREDHSFATMDAILKDELEVVEYIRAIELYSVRAIVKLSELMDRAEELTASLLNKVTPSSSVH